MRTWKAFAAIALFFLSVHAWAEVGFNGTAQFTVSGSQVTLEAARIENNSTNRTTGTLYLKLFATTSSSPDTSGYELASVQLGELSPGQYYYDVVQTTGFDAPPNGTYYMHLLLVEYPNTSTIVDYVSFGQQSFGNTGDGGGTDEGNTGGGGNGDIAIEGASSFETSGDQVTIELNRLSNNSSSRTTGTLFLKLWATTSSSPDASGYELASVQLDPLSPNQYYYDIIQTVDFTQPPAGTYYVHLLVVEYPNLSTYLDFMTYGQQTFTSPGGGGSDGGGGSGSLVLEGSSSYTAMGDQVVIELDRVSNTSSTRTTGTLFLTLWATTSSSPDASGYELASVSIGELDPNQYFYDIVQATDFTPPPAGTYYVHLLLEEYPNLSTIVDYITYGQETFSGSGGGDNGDDTGGTLSIVGTASPTYNSQGYVTEVRFPGESRSQGTVSVLNSGTSTSGALKVRVVATDEPYSGGTLSGYRMAEYDLPQALGAGEHYADFVGATTALSTHPDYGRYYVHVLLMELQPNGEYLIVDHRSSSGTVTLGCGATADCLTGDDGSSGGGSSSGGDDGGGGGAAGPALLLLLLGLALSRRRLL
jgi:MYXO-CTERM domain-containing protein